MSVLPTRTVAGRSDSSSYSSPPNSARTALRSRWGSSGFTRKPSAPLRRARNTSGRRSSNISTATGSAASFDPGNDLGPTGDLFDEELRPFECGAKFFAQGGEIARQKNNGHWFSVAEREIASLLA